MTTRKAARKGGKRQRLWFTRPQNPLLVFDATPGVDIEAKRRNLSPCVSPACRYAAQDLIEERRALDRIMENARALVLDHEEWPYELARAESYAKRWHEAYERGLERLLRGEELWNYTAGALAEDSRMHLDHYRAEIERTLRPYRALKQKKGPRVGWKRNPTFLDVVRRDGPSSKTHRAIARLLRSYDRYRILPEDEIEVAKWVSEERKNLRPEKEPRPRKKSRPR